MMAQRQADESYGPQGSTYVSQGVYQPIGAPMLGHHHPHHPHHPHHHQHGAYQGGERYAGHDQREQHTSVPTHDTSKGAQPPYGAG